MTSFETIFVTGVELDTQPDPSQARDIFEILYKWKADATVQLKDVAVKVIESGSPTIKPSTISE